MYKYEKTRYWLADLFIVKLFANVKRSGFYIKLLLR